MNAKKIYKTGSVNYGFVLGFRKWVFEWCKGKGSYIAPVQGGKPTADKIAITVSGSVKRNPKSLRLDGLAHARIAEINHI